MAEIKPPEFKEGDKLRSIRRRLKLLKQEISELSKKNYELERDVKFFDQRIALLINHRIAVEELSDRIGDYDRRVGVLKDELQQQRFGNLFYLLQTEPSYLAQLSRIVSLSEIDSLLQPVMFSLYGNQYETREEYLLLSMFELALKYEFAESENFNSLLRANTAISRMMTTYTRRGPGQEYLKCTLEEPLNDLMSQEDLVLEINPIKVYIELYGHPMDESSLTLERAMDDPEVMFRTKLRIKKLQDISSLFLGIIISSLSQVPYGIQWLCRAIKELAMEKFPEATPEQINAMIGGFFLLRFINPAIVTPTAYMLVNKQPTYTMRRNLTLIAKILQSMANKNVVSSHFKEEYMQPLQPFAINHVDLMQSFLSDLSSVPDFHESLEMEHYLSLSKDIKISITLNEMYKIHELITRHTDYLALTEDDPLHILLDELGQAEHQLPCVEDCTIHLVLTNKWGASKQVFRAESVESTFSKKLESEAVKEQCRRLLVKLLSLCPALMMESSLLNAIKRAQLEPETDWGRIGAYLLQRFQGVEEFTSVLEGDKIFFQQIKEEVQLKLMKYEKLELELKSLQRVYEALNDHGQFLREQLDAYKEYLVAVRTRAASVSKAQKRGSFGSSSSQGGNKQIRFSYNQLEREGVIIETQGIPVHRKSDISVTLASPEPGIYTIALYYKGKTSKAYETDLNLEELLEKQHLSDPVLHLNDFVVVDVKRTLLLLHKYFAST
ncbi:GTPase-activating protein isoform X2 [Nematostella vectensis]|uniref:GTPase-activating protein isoform X1 n=1 Tax=Nematostella vectensis TaxID=45351 RepID=UPI00138FFAE0|nr:GTPase-activating protein isoform X1 [Nematostella vectensis]XP_048588251.1 GTPase-activating protein isoform X2 [Nematostella vectensis]